MESGISLELIWFDDDMLEFKINASNGIFSGQTKVYESYDKFKQVAKAISGFPNSREDKRKITFGTMTSNYIDGGVEVKMSCDSTAHPRAEIIIKSEISKISELNESAAFIIPLEAAEIDKFVDELLHFENVLGNNIKLYMAK